MGASARCSGSCRVEGSLYPLSRFGLLGGSHRLPLVLYANSGNAPDYPVQECHPFGLEDWNLILLEGICLIEADKKWRRMMVYVLGNLLHEGHFGRIGPSPICP